MLRIGKKYKLNHLHDEAIVRLQSEFPSTLKEWEGLSPEYTHIVFQKGILFDIVNLATDCGVQSIFPAAYYLCVQDLVSQFTHPKPIGRIPLILGASVVW
jgi:hypothetical protein